MEMSLHACTCTCTRMCGITHVQTHVRAHTHMHVRTQAHRHIHYYELTASNNTICTTCHIILYTSVINILTMYARSYYITVFCFSYMIAQA